MSTATVIPFVPESSDSAAAIQRYREAYRVAETISEFAETAKLAGIFMAGVLVVASTMAYQLNREWHFGFPAAALILLACAVAVFLAAHIWEKIFEVQARRLQMSVDSAVHSSPFLSTAQRAMITRIRHESATVANFPLKA